MKKKKLRTITLCYSDNPTVSLCPGHVDAKTFTKAHENEGWVGGGDVDSSDLTHEYWIKQNKRWKRAVKGVQDYKGRKAKPVTVMGW